MRADEIQTGDRVAIVRGMHAGRRGLVTCLRGSIFGSKSLEQDQAEIFLDALSPEEVLRGALMLRAPVWAMVEIADLTVEA